MKRTIYRLKWDKQWGMWGLFRKGGWIELYDGATKRVAEREARQYARANWTLERIPTQLLIYNKNGRIGTGGRSEASYGCDSKRRRG